MKVKNADEFYKILERILTYMANWSIFNLKLEVSNLNF